MDNTNDGPVKPRERERASTPSSGPLQWWGRGRTFLAEVRAELRRVTWPSQAEVIATTWVVLLTSAFFGTYLWGLDMAFGRVINWAFKMLGAA